MASSPYRPPARTPEIRAWPRRFALGIGAYEAISFTPGAARSFGQTTFHSLF